VRSPTCVSVAGRTVVYRFPINIPDSCICFVLFLSDAIAWLQREPIGDSLQVASLLWLLAQTTWHEAPCTLAAGGVAESTARLLCCGGAPKADDAPIRTVRPFDEQTCTHPTPAPLKMPWALAGA
jgi:hypothetical protein